METGNGVKGEKRMQGKQETAESKVVKGYKVFKPDWTCRGFQYEVGKTYETGKAIYCETGFHFCTKAVDCFKYYDFTSENKVAEVAAVGEIDKRGENSKCCTNKIWIVRELSWYEVLDLVNTGRGCTGIGNSGNRNSGDWNSGNRNSGDGNSGDWNSGNGNSGNGNSGDGNSGNGNSGNGNSGDLNSGNGNSGDWNSGYRNSGDENSGDWNSGNGNSGNGNSGDWNSGNGNSGNGNSGYLNSGDWNSGNGNSGNGNSGYWNSGDGNSGDWNIVSYATGCFNTENPKLLFFDHPTEMTLEEWRDSKACLLMSSIRFTVWIMAEAMSEEEKQQHPEYKTAGGYLKELDRYKACNKWWDTLSERGKGVIKQIPNFDAEKFQKITGIDVRKKEAR